MLWAGLLCCSGVLAQVPTTLSYQGRLLQNDAAQGPVGGTIDIQFSIWSGPTGDPGATQLWSESWTGVGLSNGVFSVLLGSNGSPLVPSNFQNDSSLYLQLTIDGETLSPRQQLGSVPFAIVDEPANERQDLSLSGDTLSLSDDATPVDLAPYRDNTDAQDLSLTGDSLSLSNDATPVDLSGYRDNTDAQDLSLAGDTLSLSNDATPVDLSSYRDNTDEQTLSLNGTELSISGSNSSVELAGFVNTDEQDLELAGTTLSLTNDPTPVDLGGFLDNTDEQDLSLTGDTLSLSNDATPVDLSAYRDDTDQQDLSLTGTTLSLSNDPTPVNLSTFLDNTDTQTLNLSGNNLSISGSGSTVSLSAFTNTDAQTLSLSGNNLSISGSGSTVSLASFLDNTDNQNIASVLANGTDAGDRDLFNLDDVSIDRLTIDNNLTCTDCIDTVDIDEDTIGGNDITDNVFIVHIDCNGSCADMSMRNACDSVEVLRGLTEQAELIGVSCIHNIPSTTGNGFVTCPVQNGTDNECRAFNLRTLGDLPCVNGDGTDVIVTCLATDIPL
jgi:hypothetical protein